MPTEDEGSVIYWLSELKAGAPTAAQPLWERYFDPLVRLARTKLRAAHCPSADADEEDAALSAFDNFCRGWAHLVTNAVQLALADFERAIRLDGSNGDTYIGRGSARVLLSQHRAALADAEESLRHGDPNARMYYLAGRIYARAASVAANEVRQAGRETVALTASYQNRAVALIREAVRRTPSGQRAAFARNQIFTDPALRPILRRLKLDELAEHTAASTR
jgi:tetratricopeptide (TPR) repeat protein